MYACLYVCIYVCAYVCTICVCAYVCMYLYICVCISSCQKFYTGALGVYTVEDVVDNLDFGLFQFGVIMFAGATWV